MTILDEIYCIHSYANGFITIPPISHPKECSGSYGCIFPTPCKGLTMILEPPEPSKKKDGGEDDDEEEEMDVDDAGIMTTTTTLMNKMKFLEPLMKNHGWLLKNLPSLPLFHAVLPQVIVAL